jgi:hypothetical protein
MEKEDLIRIIKEWVKNDNETRTLQKEVTKRKIEKKNITVRLMEIMKQNQIDCFDINDGHILYKKKTVKKSITKSLLMNILSNYYEGNEEKASEVNSYIMDNRPVITTELIVRKINTKQLDASTSS